MKNIKGYLKGMNKDAARSKVDPNTYFDLHNFRVVTEEGSSTGAIETEKGHVLGFTIPDIPLMTLTDGTIIPAQADLKIIGWGTLVDTIVVFTTNETAPNPTNSYGQIWQLEFSETTDEVVGSIGGVLTVSTHLVYNNQTNFSTEHRIGRVIGRYETGNKQRVYWTDNYNPVRTINIADPNSLDIDLDNIDLQPGVNFAVPVIQFSGPGNLPTGAQIQFAYRLISQNGAVTLYSPASTLYPLPASDPLGASYDVLEGDGDSNTLNKSVTYEIAGIDQDFDVIEHVAILYNAPDVYTVYKFDESAIPTASDTLTVTCSDLTTAEQIPLTEYVALSSGFDRAKDIEVKDNRLVAANTTTTNFEIDYDARAYRFNAAREALILDANQGDITIDGTAPVWTIDLEHDAVNPYNIEEDYPTLPPIQYKYQADGVTLGGEGPNINYQFQTIELEALDNLEEKADPSHWEASKFSSVEPPFLLGVRDPNNNFLEVERAGQFRQFSGSYNKSFFKGHARGEIYRYGIVFYNSKGSVSFVNWIGDIKFPEPEDGGPWTIGGANSDPDPALVTPIVKTLGIIFTVDTSSLGTDITGYSIVRVEREDKDKTRLGSGMIMNWDEQNNGANDALPQQASGVLIGATWGSAFNFYGVRENPSWHLADKPGFHRPQLTANSAKRLNYLLSPLTKYKDTNFNSRAGDYVKTTGYYRARPCELRLPAGDGFSSIAYRCREFLSVANSTEPTPERFEIYKGRRLEIGEVILPGTDIIDGGYSGPSFYMRNSSYTIDSGAGGVDIPLGLGNPKLAVTLHQTPTVPHNTGDPAANMVYHLGGDFTGTVGIAPNANGTTPYTDVWFKEVLYCRYVNNQYGGNKFEDRSVNEYISTGHFQALNPSIPTTMSFSVFGGDVYVNYVDDESYEYYLEDSTPFKDPYDDPVYGLSLVVCYPAESDINIDYTEGRRWFADRFINTITPDNEYAHNDFIYNPIWSQENVATQKFFAKDFLSDFIEEQPHQLWASNNKIDGELIDSWRQFPIANATQVNGVHGPINRIINFKDRLYFYQDKGFGVAAIDERSVITDESGQQLTLGVGGVFPDYSYISTNTGSFHQFGVTASENALYHYDARLKKVYRYTGQGSTPLSDLKGMSAYFDNAIDGEIRKSDFTTRITNSIGIHASPDFRYNRVLFTFLNTVQGVNVNEFYDRGTNAYTFTEGSIIEQGGLLYCVIAGFSVDAGTPPREPNLELFVGVNLKRVTEDERAFTVSYNEMLEAFESFYDYKPPLYLQYGRRLLSVNPNSRDEAWVHNEGPYGEYYGGSPAISRLETILAAEGNVTKIFNNIAYKAELYDTNKSDIFNETFDRMRVYNEYQDTTTFNLIVDDNIKRRMRTWRTTIPRDNTDLKSRIRNPWTHLVLEFDNNDNKRHVIHDIIYSFSMSPL